MPVPEFVADYVPLDLSVLGTTLSPVGVDRKLRDARNQMFNAFNRLTEVYLGTPEELKDPRLIELLQTPHPLIAQLDDILWEMHVKHGNH